MIILLLMLLRVTEQVRVALSMAGTLVFAENGFLRIRSDRSGNFPNIAGLDDFAGAWRIRIRQKSRGTIASSYVS